MTDAFPAAAKMMSFIIPRDREVAKKFYDDTLGFRQMARTISPSSSS